MSIDPVAADEVFVESVHEETHPSIDVFEVCKRVGVVSRGQVMGIECDSIVCLISA